MKKVAFIDLGKMEYGKAWKLQEELVQSIKENKETAGFFIMVEHQPVLTIGKEGGFENLVYTTVPSLYGTIRPSASYAGSINLLKLIKDMDNNIITKTGMMLGLGETEEEVIDVMDQLREAHCDILTLGQYLKPTEQHADIKEYITPEMFEAYKKMALEKEFRFVESGPFVRSSYHAAEGMKIIS